MVSINGVSVESDGKTLLEYLRSEKFDLNRIAVERNGEIVPKARYGETVLNSGDIVEIVSFVGGG